LKLQEKYTIEKGGISMQNDWQGEQILPENAGFLTIIVCLLIKHTTHIQTVLTTRGKTFCNLFQQKNSNAQTQCKAV
jgi:hypothetical protein